MGASEPLKRREKDEEVGDAAILAISAPPAGEIIIRKSRGMISLDGPRNLVDRR